VTTHPELLPPSKFSLGFLRIPLKCAVFALRAWVTLFVLGGVAQAEPAYVDVSTVMELAGAHNDEIALARLKHQESLAREKLAWQRFWPSLSIGASYRGHEGQVQDIAGLIFDASKRQYSAGAEVLVDWSPGDLYFSALAAQQSAAAAGHLAESARRAIVVEAVRRYFQLLAAEARLAIMEDDLRLTQDYARQLEGAVTAGTSIRADLLRVQTGVSRARLSIREAQEARDLAAAALAETLRIPAESELRAAKADLLPVTMVEGFEPEPAIDEATHKRPELQAALAQAEAAALERERARLAPVIPNLRAGYTGGGLGGGIVGDVGGFNDAQDFFVGFGWKIGPGGLFDKQSQNIAEARKAAAGLESDRVKAAIGREVVDAMTRSRSAHDRILINEEAVSAAEQMVELAEQRQASQVGVVLEYLLAREELTRARQDRVTAVSDFNTAQHELRRALGR
jgi:outer membrane protein TolC